MQCGAVWRKRALFLPTCPPCVCSELRISTFKLIKLHIHEARHLICFLPPVIMYATIPKIATSPAMNVWRLLRRAVSSHGGFIHKHQAKIHHWVSVSDPVGRTIVQRGSRANAHSVTRLKRGEASNDRLVHGPRCLVVRIHGQM
jgi:hypothetical protein